MRRLLLAIALLAGLGAAGAAAVHTLTAPALADQSAGGGGGA
jgi:hypothetical protein